MSSAPIVVQKFGGTSVATPDHRRAVVGHVRRARETGTLVVAVVSAMGRRGDPYATDTLLDLLRADGGPVDPADYDLMFASGEIISTAVVSQALKRNGIPARGLTAVQAGLVTDGRHLEAEFTTIDPRRLRALLAAGLVPVVCGGQGIAPGTSDFTSLGRGGSDTSAVAIGVALGAERVDIFTDVDGVLTTDPRIVPGARRLDRVSYGRCHELARFGAKVVHPRALLVGWRGGLPLGVRATLSDSPGTLVTVDGDDAPMTGVARLAPMHTATLDAETISPETLADWERSVLALSLRDDASGRLLVGAPPDYAAALASLIAVLTHEDRVPLVEQAWVSAIGAPDALDAGHDAARAALAAAGCRTVASVRAGCRTTFVVASDAAAAAVTALHRQYLG